MVYAMSFECPFAYTFVRVTSKNVKCQLKVKLLYNVLTFFAVPSLCFEATVQKTELRLCLLFLAVLLSVLLSVELKLKSNGNGYFPSTPSCDLTLSVTGGFPADSGPCSLSQSDELVSCNNVDTRF